MLEEINPITNVELFKRRLWMTEYAFRMQNWFKEEKAAPVRIDAEPHRRCNLDCTMCSRKSSPIDLTEESKRIELPDKKWFDIVKESGEMGVKCWNISGIGEPMCKPELTLSMMKSIKAYDMFGELTTNGTLWKENQIKSVIKMNWDSACVSIDAPDAKTHDFLRGLEGTFEKATNTVKSFRIWRDRFCSQLPLLTINMAINKMNYSKIPEMVEFASKIGADALFAEPMIVYSPEGEKLKLDDQEISRLPKIIKETKRLGEENNIFTTITCITPEKQFQPKLIKETSNIRSVLIEDSEKHSGDEILSIPCYYPWFYLMIRADGSVAHCGEWAGDQENIKNKSLSEIWYGEKLEEIRENFKKKTLPASCDKCRPNVIEDMREMRKGMKKYTDIRNLQKETIDLLNENREIKKRLYELKKEGKLNMRQIKHRRDEICVHEKELIKIKNSLSYKIGKKVGNTRIGKIMKKKFGVYV